MNWFNNAPIRVKLISIMTLTAMLALFLATSAVVINEYYSKKHDTEKQLKLMGDIISWNASASLTFKDLQTAQEMLKGLHAQPSLISAQLYDNSGHIFVDYSSAKYNESDVTGKDLISRIHLQKNIKQPSSVFKFIPAVDSAWLNEILSSNSQNSNSSEYSESIFYENNTLHLYRPILLDGELQGVLHLVDDQSGQKTLLNRFYLIIFLIVVITGFAILVISTKLQSVFLAPLLALMQAMRLVTQEKNFSRRVTQIGADEFGEMASVYNAMLSEIQLRDQQLALHRVRLEQQVIARTHELSEKNENLGIAVQEAVNAKEIAEAASKAKSQFLATMSHEIRTPMNGVLGMTELLVNTELNHRQKHLAETAYRSAESLLGIINNILDFSKIEACKCQLNLNAFDIRILLEETSEILACQAHQKKLELVLNMPVDFEGVVLGDCERLRQVLINLVGNAIKFTQSGEVQLKISVIHDDNLSIHIQFEVIDTGPGVPAEQQESIFESFTQVDGSITRRFGGTGLGLTISRQLVDLMGGVLKVESNLGQGARFYFDLVFERSQQPVFLKANIKALQGIRILVVDDNHTNREILHDQLSYWGVIPTCVDSAEAALKNLELNYQENNRYGLILLDWHMPNMDGLNLAKLIQNYSRYRGTPMIMLSSDNLELEAEKELIYGISAFLTKPVIQQKLMNCLLDVLGQRMSPEKRQVLPKSKKLTHNQKARILLAEDQPVNQQVGYYMLLDMGYEVDIANNGLEAVKRSALNVYNLILMDCHMPEMDGFEATKAIRNREQAEPEYGRIPIIALTADVQKGIAEQCLESGMDSYVSKPFSKMVLQNVLDEWMLAASTEASAILEESNESDQQASQISDCTDVILNQVALENLIQIKTEQGGTLLNHAIKLFLQSEKETLPKLHKAFSDRDSESLRREAHAYKSACANLGADDLAEICARIEILAKQGDLQDIPKLLSNLEFNLAQVNKLLNNILDQEDIDEIEITENRQVEAEINGTRILLVDDDSQFRQITRSVLTASGFIVDEAADGIQALDVIEREIPDLVLLDAVMDGLDGFETCRLMRNIEKIADVPIIMSTGLGDLGSIYRAFEVGATDFVIKPLNYPILVHRLWFIIRAHQNTAELRTSKIQLSAAQRIARLGYWTWNSTKNQFLISENLADFCGTKIDSFNQTLESFIELVYPEDQEKVKSIILSAIDNKLTSTPCEYRLQPDPYVLIYVVQEIEAITETNHCIIIGTVQDITHKKQAEMQMHRLAYYDNLTGLASRAYYHERIADYIRVALRQEEQFAFLFIDLDGFKDINDSFGHDVGDHFLKAIAERIKLVVRDMDFAARLGGDEFCIILDKISEPERAAEVADRCLLKLNQPLKIHHHQIKPRASIGIAFFPRDGFSEVELMKAADAAMYSAKQNGKQRYVFYSRDMASQAISRLETEQMLHDAFEFNQFVLYYQPQVSMLTGKIVALEALVRWQHPEKGLLPPMDFIPLLEQMGLMTDLGNWALINACQQILAWRNLGLPFVRVAVNITPAHFQDPALFTFITELLAETGIPNEFLELEVTESAMQTQGSFDVFRRLRESGLKIALDDFGTGYSCLASLNQLPLDCLKVDRIFVADVLSNANTALLLGTIIGLANALDYTVVAEGVETKEQALVMHGLGCHIVQGYLFSHPVAGDKIPDLLPRDFTLVQNQN